MSFIELQRHKDGRTTNRKPNYSALIIKLMALN